MDRVVSRYLVVLKTFILTIITVCVFSRIYWLLIIVYVFVLLFWGRFWILIWGNCVLETRISFFCFRDIRGIKEKVIVLRDFFFLLVLLWLLYLLYVFNSKLTFVLSLVHFLQIKYIFFICSIAYRSFLDYSLFKYLNYCLIEYIHFNQI